MKSRPPVVRSVVLAAVVGSAVLSGAAEPATAQPGAWRPEQNVEISVATAPGGGADRTARFIMKSDDTVNFLRAQHAEIRSVLTELGMAK